MDTVSVLSYHLQECKHWLRKHTPLAAQKIFCTAVELHSNLHSCTMHIRASNYCRVLYLQFRVQEQL